LVISCLKIFVAFPIPILFALMLNELRARRFKKFVQTASYLPHFISWVVVQGLCLMLFGTVNGAANNMLMSLHLITKPLAVLTNPQYYWPLALITEVWKESGWGAIIYIAAIAGVSQDLYDAAQVDGASRLRRVWHVTLPGIRGTIVIMFVLSLGGLVSGNLEQARLFSNGLNNSTSMIINLYVLNVGLTNYRFDYAAAVGLMQALISVCLVLGGNGVARKLTGAGLY
jgi:putative aldouronate transport system permease protein